jgi:hypothetical protein
MDSTRIQPTRDFPTSPRICIQGVCSDARRYYHCPTDIQSPRDSEDSPMCVVLQRETNSYEPWDHEDLPDVDRPETGLGFEHCIFFTFNTFNYHAAGALRRWGGRRKGGKEKQTYIRGAEKYTDLRASR